MKKIYSCVQKFSAVAVKYLRQVLRGWMLCIAWLQSDVLQTARGKRCCIFRVFSVTIAEGAKDACGVRFTRWHLDCHAVSQNVSCTGWPPWKQSLPSQLLDNTLPAVKDRGQTDHVDNLAKPNPNRDLTYVLDFWSPTTYRMGQKSGATDSWP